MFGPELGEGGQPAAAEEDGSEGVSQIVVAQVDAVANDQDHPAACRQHQEEALFIVFKQVPGQAADQPAKQERAEDVAAGKAGSGIGQ